MFLRDKKQYCAGFAILVEFSFLSVTTLEFISIFVTSYNFQWKENSYSFLWKWLLSNVPRRFKERHLSNTIHE